MVYAIVLSGGSGTRIQTDIPKQYIQVSGKPIICYCLECLQRFSRIDAIIVVVSQQWQSFVENHINKYGISKFKSFAEAGPSRQHSIYNGLKTLQKIGASDDDIVIIHDAARPNLSERILLDCIEKIEGADGVMPALPVKDTIYLSKNGIAIDSLLNRSQLFAGQAPESYRYGKYFRAHENVSYEDLFKIRGSSEIAFLNNMNIVLTIGDEHNYKITTMADLTNFCREQKGNKEDNL